MTTEFYRFVFQFSREGTHKTIGKSYFSISFSMIKLDVCDGLAEKDVIAQLLPLVLDEQRAPHLPYFLSFLSSCSQTRITLDQWDSFLLFNHNVHVNLDNWEEGGAWPLLLDEYVEWRHKQGSK